MSLGPFTCQDWVVRVGTFLVVTCCFFGPPTSHASATGTASTIPCCSQSLSASCGSTTAYSRHHQWETHPDLYDQPTANQLNIMLLTLHTLCQQITQEIATQQNELEKVLSKRGSNACHTVRLQVATSG